MAQIRVEKRPKLSVMWLVVALLALVLLFWGLSAALNPDRSGDVRVGQETNLVIPYEGREWVPMSVDQAARFNDDEMRVVGTVNGVNLYATDEGVGGGGGGNAVDVPENVETGPFGRIYVRMADGRYLPMVWRSEVK